MDLQLTDLKERHSQLLGDFGIVRAELNGVKLLNSREKADLESRVAKLLRDLETVEANKKYACDHISQQNQLIRDAKHAFETLRSENEGNKTQAAHLAKKVVELNNKLTLQGDSERCGYRKQGGIHGDFLGCGKCTACQLESANGIIERITASVAKLEKERDAALKEVQFSKSVLNQTVENFQKLTRENQAVKSAAQADLTVKNCIETDLTRETELRKALQSEIRHLKEVIRLQGNALQLISNGWFWERKGYADIAMQGVKAYKEEHNIL